MFQSTRPMRGATTNVMRAVIFDKFQSTRPMRGATTECVNVTYVYDVSIHAPHAGRDWRRWRHPQRRQRFNPRAPCGARLGHACDKRNLPEVSIHAPHAGRDLVLPDLLPSYRVSIHAPHAGRDTTDGMSHLPNSAFQSTRPMRGATAPPCTCRGRQVFQSTRPMRGATGTAT